MLKKLYGTSFFGNEASGYAKKNNRLDYATLAKSFDAVLNNNIIEATADIGYWEIENGSEEYYEDNSGNIYTYDEKKHALRNSKLKLRNLKNSKQKNLRLKSRN
jgi:hypothetical protein